MLGKLDRYMEKHKTRPPFIPYTRINSKYIEHLNLRLETRTLLEENIGSKLSDIAFMVFFIMIYPLGQGKQKKKNKRDYSKLNSLYTAKEIMNKTQDNLPNGRSYSPTIHSYGVNIQNL